MNSKITSLERSTLLNFLKTGLSTRQLDSQIGENPQKSKGWKSWKILQKYKIKTTDSGSLFCFRKVEALNIINKIMKAQNYEEVNKLLRYSEPRFFNKYKDIYVVADSNEKVAILLSGEVRNITQSFFNPIKKIIGKCQFPDCDNTNLDTVHLQKSRPENLKMACLHGKVSDSNKYDAYKI